VVRECTGVDAAAKREDITLLIVVYRYQNGYAIAGPVSTEHLVIRCWYFEGRSLCQSPPTALSQKNRFGATSRNRRVEMAGQGITGTRSYFSNREEVAPGTALVVACRTCPIVVELQALVSPTSYACRDASTTGINRCCNCSSFGKPSAFIVEI